MTDLTGKIALVTGASRGIGRAVALAYAKAGAHVIAVARTTGALEELDDEIKTAGGTATLMPLDLRAFDKIDMMGPALVEKFGGLDIFVANAAMMGIQTPVPHMDAKEWDRVIETNLVANFRLLRTLDPLLRQSAAGRVIAVSSRRAHTCDAYWGYYSVSKAAFDALMKTYAAETVQTAVRVNTILPGFVETPGLKAAYPGGYHGSAKVRKPEDIVPAFLELAADAEARHGAVIDLYAAA